MRLTACYRDSKLQTLAGHEIGNGFEVLAAVDMKSCIFWDITKISYVVHSSTLKMEEDMLLLNFG
jgi:hypothetical protein